MSNSEDIIVIKDGDAKIVLDNRYFPILMGAWDGEPTLGLCEQYFEVRNRIFFERAEKQGITKVVQASDLSRMKTPPATVRKFMADVGGKQEAASSAFGGYCVVVPNAMLRGMVTAFTWITGKSDTVRGFFPIINEAMAKASSILAEAGVDSPTVDFSNYKVPEQ